jgi:hypothetical protein
MGNVGVDYRRTRETLWLDIVIFFIVLPLIILKMWISAKLDE